MVRVVGIKSYIVALLNELQGIYLQQHENESNGR